MNWVAEALMLKNSEIDDCLWQRVDAGCADGMDASDCSSV